MVSPVVATPPWAPDCMDASDFADWSRLNGGLTAAGFKVPRPCNDCPPEFAAEMSAIGRCNGVPLGGRPEEDPMPEPITLAGKRVAVAVTAPCGSCAHAVVCSIRPSVEALTSLTVITPNLDAAVAFSMAASVTCEHYAKAKGKPAVAADPSAPRKLNLSQEERERRSRQAIAMTAARRGDVPA